jgi:hypothetical protein
MIEFKTMGAVPLAALLNPALTQQPLGIARNSTSLASLLTHAATRPDRKPLAKAQRRKLVLHRGG